MMADDVACNSRNKEAGSVFNHYDRKVDVYGDNIEVDYRGRHNKEVPRSKRLMSDSKSNILIYLTGHGGDGFLKFQDAEEITSYDLADAFDQMWEKSRYDSILFITDTCQAKSLYDKIYTPHIISIASSLIGESSYSHHVDRILGVPVVDRFTNHLLAYFESIDIDSPLTIQDFVDSWKDTNIFSTPSISSTHPTKALFQFKLTDFFGHVPKVDITRTRVLLPDHTSQDLVHPIFLENATYQTKGEPELHYPISLGRPVEDQETLGPVYLLVVLFLVLLSLLSLLLYKKKKID